MRGRAREWRVALLLATLSTLIGVALAELAARVLLRPPPALDGLGTPISELSKTLGWRVRPNGHQRIRRSEFDITIRVNSRGLRGPEFPYLAAPGKRRLAIMGDSFAHGYYADEPDTLAGRLSRALEPCGVDVLNAGAPGYSTDQQWLFFAEEIHQYRPSEIVLLFYYNDLQFNLEGVGTANRAKPVFVEREGVLEIVPPKLASVPPEELQTTVIRSGAPTFRGSALWAFATTRLLRTRPDWSRTLSEYGLAPALSSVPPAEYLPFGPANATERARVELMWKRTMDLLRLFRDDVRGRGAGFTVFHVPARFEVNDDAWRFITRRYERERPWNREAVRSRLAADLAALDIPLIESRSSFEAAERTKVAAYLPLDGHWNAKGNEIAFDSLFPQMRRAFSCGS